MKQFLILLFFSIIVTSIQSQDVYYSQIMNNPLYLNPANTGMAEKKNRLVFLYRDQWRSVPVSYSSTIVSYDAKVINKNNNIFGIGSHIFYDKAGDGHLSNLRIDISGSYGRYLKKDNHLLSIGFQTGFTQRRVDMSKLTFNSQFNGFDNGLAVFDDNFSQNLSVADFSVGLLYRPTIKEKAVMNFGFVINNTLQNNLFFTSNDMNISSREIRYGTYVNSEIPINSQWKILPGVYFQNQNSIRQYLLQFVASHQFEKPVALDFGAMYRYADALIPYMGVQFKGIVLGASYDVNLSSFNAATNYRGGFELSLRYEFERKKKELELVVEELEVVESIVEEEVKEIVQEETTIEPIEFEGFEPEVVFSMNLLREHLPVKIYFDNNQPDPGSMDSNTDKNYAVLFNSYKEKYFNFIESNKNEEKLVNFYEETLVSGFEKLQVFEDNLIKILKNGHRVNLQMMGHASSTGTSEYNQLISSRRIKSIVNYLLSSRNNLYSEYIQNGQLIIEEVPLGSSEASDFENTFWDYLGKSTLNPSQSFERFVKIIAINLE